MRKKRSPAQRQRGQMRILSPDENTRGFPLTPGRNNNNMASHGLDYDGCNFFRQRLVLSTLSGKRVRIKKHKVQRRQPGAPRFRGQLYQTVDKVTNGSRIEINQTALDRLLSGGSAHAGSIHEDLMKVTLKGVTNDHIDPTVDVLKSTALPLMKQFGIDGEGFDLKVVKRGMAPGGGGEVVFICPTRRTMRPVQLTDPGKIKRIRGMANRIVDTARGVLNKFIPDIYIYTDHMKGANSGKSPGFGLTLVAETMNGSFLSAEMSSTPQGQGDPMLPEDLGKNCAQMLLEEVYRGGCVDSSNQSLALLLMTLGQQDVSKVLLGPLSPHTIEFLRHIRDFFQIMFKIQVQKPSEDERKGGDKVLMTCVGVGYSNINKTLK
ncbi:hypothetical protein F7725_015430 [Dissostichus mawsoni]|uniref:RNA 3'-terminal phosphate cyclase-like protein n=1 Tax=Dissostichus mawsoni TaxID=36200 RepID=A0A7J5YID6_DISMA|nr:hypothetical protein F7725_015430 [Dissostichus mawsoni]